MRRDDRIPTIRVSAAASIAAVATTILRTRAVTTTVIARGSTPLGTAIGTTCAASRCTETPTVVTTTATVRGTGGSRSIATVSRRATTRVTATGAIRTVAI